MLRHVSVLIVVLGLSVTASAESWIKVTEDDRAVTIDSDLIQAVIPKKQPKQWMSGIEKGSFLDKKTGAREIGDGLMVVDWIMEAGNDVAYRDKLDPSEKTAVGPYLWWENETDPRRIEYAVNAHGTSRPKRAVEGPQRCPHLKPHQPAIIQHPDFVAVRTTSQFEFAAPGKKSGSTWTQLVVFPKGKRYFLLMDQIDSVNDSPEMFLRNDTPGCVRHVNGDTFSEMYLSYFGGKPGTRIPSSEFFLPFPPDLKFGYRRDQNHAPEHFIRAYHIRDPKTGKDGPWLGGLTLDSSVVYEAWCSMRTGGIIVMIEEIHGRPVKAGETFSAAHIVGFFDSIEEMHEVCEAHKGNKKLVANEQGWKLAP